jgi:Tol biopolymer transport system component
MSRSDPFEMLITDALDDLVTPSYPDYFDDALATALHRRQRPRWTFPERWIPMSTATRRSVFGPVLPYRRIAILLAILALLIAAAAAVSLIGSPQSVTQVPPYGPAANGLVTYAVDGDIYVREMGGGPSRLVVGGDEFDVSPTFSRDGTMLSFIRLNANPNDPAQEVTQESLYVANADGSDARLLITTDAGHGFSWSPDGTQIAVITSEGSQAVLSVINVSDGAARSLSLPVVPLDAVEWRPPDGRELIFRGQEGAAVRIYSVHPDGTGLRELTSIGTTENFVPSGTEYSISPDGRTLLYTRRGTTWTIRQLDLDTGADTQWGTALPAISGDPALPAHATNPVFSPDGTKVIFARYWDQQGQTINRQVFIATFASDGADAVPLGTELRSQAEPFDFGFSPDGTRVIIRYFDSDKTLLVDPVTQESEQMPWGVVTDYPSWQRRPAQP